MNLKSVLMFFAKDKILGMRILTSDVMQELVDFYNKTKIEYDIHIKGNELYIRFHTGMVFEIENMKQGPLNEKEIKVYFDILNFTNVLATKLIEVIDHIEI